MIERFRALLERPVDEHQARAVVFVASCLTVAFALLVAQGVVDGSRPGAPDPRSASATTVPSAPPVVSSAGPSVGSAAGPGSTPRPDPGRLGSDVFPARRVKADRGALGVVAHLPYRRRHVRIELVGRRRGTVVVRITARTGREARSAWRRFLGRFHDAGRAYRVVFERGGRRGG